MGSLLQLIMMGLNFSHCNCSAVAPCAQSFNFQTCQSETCSTAKV